MSKREDKRSFYLVSAAAVTVVVAGWITGTRPPTREHRLSGVESGTEAQPARSYFELREGRRGPGEGMYDGAFEWLRGLGPSLTAPVHQTEEERLAALEARRQRRAFAGAPPVIPHPVQEREPGACLSCHRTGALVGDLRAPMMSHDEYTVCVQCHAPQREAFRIAASLPAVSEENGFEGVAEAGPGDIAWEGAPPLIPHATFMREECNSCHGPFGAQGLKTPHPVRANCTQCHAGSASFDQNAPPAIAAQVRGEPL